MPNSLSRNVLGCRPKEGCTTSQVWTSATSRNSFRVNCMSGSWDNGPTEVMGPSQSPLYLTVPHFFPSFVPSYVPPRLPLSLPVPCLFNGGTCLFQVKSSQDTSLRMPYKWHICKEGQAGNNKMIISRLACVFWTNCRNLFGRIFWTSNGHPRTASHQRHFWVLGSLK
jgi:hypothetical protein